MLRDTWPEAAEVYWRRLREMTPSERGKLGAALWKAGYVLQLAGIRRKFPEASQEEILYRMAVSRFGEGLARRVYKKS